MLGDIADAHAVEFLVINDKYEMAEETAEQGALAGLEPVKCTKECRACGGNGQGWGWRRERGEGSNSVSEPERYASR